MGRSHDHADELLGRELRLCDGEAPGRRFRSEEIRQPFQNPRRPSVEERPGKPRNPMTLGEQEPLQGQRQG